MYTEYDLMPPTSRVWVYQSDSRLSDEEVFQLNAQIRSFCEKWEAHKQPVRAFGVILHNHILVLMADNDFHEVSGCSIDSSVAFVKAAGASVGVDFFNRMNVAVYLDDQWQVVPLATFKALLTDGSITPAHRVFNHLIGTKAELEQRFSVPVSESWLAKYLPQTV
jgi:hypothetical protein